MNDMKKLAFAIMIPLAGVAFMASCSKEPESKTGKTSATAAKNKTAKKPKKGGKAAIAKAEAASQDGNNTLTAVRDGQYANLNWHGDMPSSEIKRISIDRSSTGVNMKRKVAELKSDATSYRDCMPDENAQWYWVNLVGTDNKVHTIGPARVEPDNVGSAAHYIKPEDVYQASVTRTDELATLKWNFPDGEYKLIQIVRNTKPIGQPFKGGGSAHVLTTLEGKSQYNNALPDTNAEYWYWFQITTKSGAIIYKGPVKAEYAKRASR